MKRHRLLSLVFALLLAVSCFPVTPPPARADSTEVRYYFLDAVYDLWPAQSDIPADQPTAPAQITIGGTTSKATIGSGGTSGTSYVTQDASSLANATAALDVSNLQNIKSLMEGQNVGDQVTIPSGASNYYFAGWWASDAVKTSQRTFVTSNATVTPDDVQAYMSSSAHNASLPVALYPVYLPKSQLGEMELLLLDSSPSNGTPFGVSNALLVLFDPETRDIKSIVRSSRDAADGYVPQELASVDISGEPATYELLDFTPADYQNINNTKYYTRSNSENDFKGDWTADATNGFWGYVTNPGASGPAQRWINKQSTYTPHDYTLNPTKLTKGQLETFLKANLKPGEEVYRRGYNYRYPEHYYPSYSPEYESSFSLWVTSAKNTLNLTFASDTTSSAKTKALKLGDTDEIGDIPTLADLQADTDLGAAFAAPSGKKFDGWFVTTTQGETVPASSSAAGAKAHSDTSLPTHFDTLLKTTTGISYYLYPIWLDQSLGWRSEDGADKYYESVSGVPTAVTGLKTIAGATYFFDASGKLQTGMRTEGGTTYYFDPNQGDGPSKSGAAAKNRLVTVEGATYFFDENGAMATNRSVSTGGKTYYAGADGKLVSGWQGTGDARRYYVPSEQGAMATNRMLDISGDGAYLFKPNGSYYQGCITGWQGDFYAFGSDGKRLSGWQTLNETTRHFSPADGKMSRDGLAATSTGSYFFNYNGSWVTSEVRSLDDGDHYFEDSGKMAVSKKVTIDGLTFDADANGVLTYPFHTQASGFTLGRHNNNYVHSNYSSGKYRGGFAGKRNYVISDSFYQQLTRNASATDKYLVQWLMNDSWGGSCYGIAATMGLSFLGKLSMNELTRTGATSYYAMPAPANDAKQYNVVNYYMLSQVLGAYRPGKIAAAWAYPSYGSVFSNFKGKGSLKSCLSYIVNNPGGDKVRMLCYGRGGWGHAILITGVTFSAARGQYDVQLYDMNSYGWTSNRGRFTHMYVARDFSSFSLTDGNGTVVTDQNYNHLNVINMRAFDPLKPTGLSTASLTSESVLSGEGHALATAADANADLNAPAAGHVTITIPLTGSFTVTNAAGQKLVYNGVALSGDLPVYDFAPVALDSKAFYQVETDDSTFTVTTDDKQVNFTVRDADSFAGVRASNVDRATLDDDGKVELEGKNTEFEAAVSTEREGGNGLMSLEGTASDGVTLERQGTSDVHVTANGGLSDLEATRYEDNKVNEVALDKSAPFTVNVENDFPAGGAKADEPADDLNDQGRSEDPGEEDPETPGSPDSPSSPESPSSPSTPASPDDPAVLYPEDRDYWVDAGAGSGEAHWYVYRAGKLRRSCWVWLDGYWYYLGDDGEMLVGKQKLEFFDTTGYYFFNPEHDGTYGRMRVGWFHDGNAWHYMYRESDHMTAGMVATGWNHVDGAWYYFDREGHMTTGWMWDGGWYFMADDGHMIASGWALDGGKWYWLNESGLLVKNAWVWDGNAWYWADGDGVCA